MKTFKSFITILNWQTLIIVILSITATYFCRIFDLTAKFPLTLIGIAVVFPLVFSINTAYKRRETALKHYGVLKGHGRALFFVTKHWFINENKENTIALKNSIKVLFYSINQFLHNKGESHIQSEKEVYKNFDKMSRILVSFKDNGLSAGEVSRANQYLSKMIVSFEELKHIYQYRTPLTLRAYSKIFINILPIIYGPYFADVTKDEGLPMAFILPILFSLILVSLDNIQEHLENPFDKIGEDDVSINSIKFVDSLED